MRAERGERVAQRLLELLTARDQVLRLVGVEHRERGGRARRVAGVGGAVAQHRAAGALEERRGHGAVDDHAAERQEAARHALGERDHGRLDARPALDPEPRPEAAEGADHGVGDEQDPVLLAQVGDALDVALGRRVDAAGADHGLAEERRDALRADAQDLGLQRRQRVVLHGGGVRDQRAPVGRVRLDPADRRAERVRPVVAVRAADDVDALRLPGDDPVPARDLRRRVDRVAAARGEEDLGVVHRGERGQPCGQLVGGRVAEVAERRVGRQAVHLGRDRAGHVGAAVPQVRVPQAGRPVEIAAPLRVEDVHPLAALDHELRVRDGAHVGERVPEGGGPGAGHVGGDGHDRTVVGTQGRSRPIRSRGSVPDRRTRRTGAAHGASVADDEVGARGEQREARELGRGDGLALDAEPAVVVDRERDGELAGDRRRRQAARAERAHRPDDRRDVERADQPAADQRPPGRVAGVRDPAEAAGDRGDGEQRGQADGEGDDGRGEPARRAPEQRVERGLERERAADDGGQHDGDAAVHHASSGRSRAGGQRREHGRHQHRDAEQRPQARVERAGQVADRARGERAERGDRVADEEHQRRGRTGLRRPAARCRGTSSARSGTRCRARPR